MGLVLLTRRLVCAAALGLAVVACGRARTAEPHAAVACAGCHRGAAADTGRGEVTAASCDRSGCHAEAGPDSARIAMVTFRHRNHGSRGGAAAVRCAACHRHRPGDVTLVADTAACALCHYRDIAAAREPRCATCHPSPRHTRMTSQGVPISHAGLEQARVPCTRCHYELFEGRADSAKGRCRECHRDTRRTRPLLAVLDSLRPRRAPPGREATLSARASGDIARRAATTDSLHVAHRGFACTACHAPVRHRIVAMSTSVALSCADCHASRHRRPIAADTLPASRCDDCHRGVHAEEQRLILGLLPEEPIRPSPMFMGGVTCRSCHVVPGRPGPRPGESLVATGAACTGCHGEQWTGVLARWRRGYHRRDQWVAAYVAAAARALGDSSAPAAARARVRRAQSLLAFLRAAGPLHNLPVSDRMMREAVALTEQAYAAARRAAPAPPELGPPVETGTCISCHFGIEEVAADRDTVSGRTFTHGDHMMRGGMTCDACHAAGAAPPGLPDTLWIDTNRAERGPRTQTRQKT